MGGPEAGDRRVETSNGQVSCQRDHGGAGSDTAWCGGFPQGISRSLPHKGTPRGFSAGLLGRLPLDLLLIIFLVVRRRERGGGGAATLSMDAVYLQGAGVGHERGDIMLGSFEAFFADDVAKGENTVGLAQAIQDALG